MQLSDHQLDYYVQNVLAFRRDDKQKYQAQIDFLKETLTKAIHENSELHVQKINQAGSWRKGTALKPRDGFAVDIDLIVYLDVSEATRSEVETLHDLLVNLLCAAYPTKERSDFKLSKKTVGVEFRTSGLKVDLVPVIPVKDMADFVWQPRVGGTGSFVTSPAGQLAFISALKERDPRFATVVRILKRWRNVTELESLSSFTIELITAHVVMKHGPPPRIEEGVLRVLHEVAQSGLRAPITFPAAIRNCPATTSPVRIFDPTNNENNVTEMTTEAERIEIVRSATEALETLNLAQNVQRKGETLDCWKQVLGPSFAIEEA
jgi:hypothetical protein